MRLKALLEEVLAAASPDDNGTHPDWQLRRRELDARIWELGWAVVANAATRHTFYYEPVAGESWQVVPFVTNSLEAAFTLADQVLGIGWCGEHRRVLGKDGARRFTTRFYRQEDPEGGFEATHRHEAMSAVAAFIGAKLVRGS